MWFIILLWIGCQAVGQYTPQKDGQGRLLPKQCYGSTGFCWCVSPDGTHLTPPVGPGQPLICY